jgi:hypothetical protein
MCKQCGIAWPGMLLPQGDLVEIMLFQAIDVNPRFLSETNNLGKRPCVNPWQRTVAGFGKRLEVWLENLAR